jgi:hypothetical protein
MTHRSFLGLALAALALSPAAAEAQTAQRSADGAAVWTIQEENASISTAELADRDYTNGIRLGWTSAEDAAPDFLQALGQTLWGDGRQRVSIDLSQQIYTPTNNTVANPPPNDRPYAGVLLATATLIHDSADVRSALGLGLGVVGPAALGEEVQNGFHDLIGQRRTRGWDTQLRDEPLLQITSQRVWRLPLGSVGGLQTDALPMLTAGIGNLRDYAMAGVTLRIGQGLASDYGVARILPGLSGTDVFRPTRPLAWYLFLGADGQAVAYDLTLEGNTWQKSRSVTIKPAVGEFQVGLAVMAYGVRVTYTQVLQTQEYEHQKGGLHQFGSLALSVRF